MNGEVKDSFEIYGDKTIHPEVPDEYISGICESGIRNIHHEGCLKEWSKLYGTKLKEKHISDIHFNSFIYNMGDPFSKQFFYRSVGYELSQEELSVDLDSFKLQFLKEEEISDMSGNFTLN